MDVPQFAKCHCPTCATRLEFSTSDAGATVDCPGCSQPVELIIETKPPGESGAALTAQDIAGAFSGSISRTPVSAFYQIGLVCVTVAMVLLPLIYLGMIAGVGWLTWKWGASVGLLFGGFGGGRVLILKAFLYLAPLLAGIAVLISMVKPLLARRGPFAQPLALNPGAEPLVFSLVHRLCQTVGAPTPTRIDVDCQLNASAGFRRGMLSFAGNDLVLTIGMPLVAGLNLRQLTGVLAHEFGHFTQGFGMRLTYLIRTINDWFARAVYERDAWDEWLAESDEETDVRIQMLVGVARFAVSIARGVLWVLLMIGHLIGSFMLRQMEFDADSYEIKVAGSDGFESTTRRMHVLGAVTSLAYKKMRVPWNLSKTLPDSFPAYMMKQEAELPQAQRQAVEDTLGLKASGLFDSHPSAGDRIRKARAAQEPGVFHLDAPATALFSNFAVLSKQVSALHYEDDMGIPLQLAKLKPVDALESPAAESASTESPQVPRTLILPSMRAKALSAENQSGSATG